jgi:Protein of unknown function (DUF3987)
MSEGNGQVHHRAAITQECDTDQPLPLWFVYHQAERDALRSLGLDAIVRQELNCDGRHVIVMVGAGDYHAGSCQLTDAQSLYGAGALSVRIVVIPTGRNSTLVDLLASQVLTIAELEQWAEDAEPVADQHVEPWPELALREAPEAVPFPVEIFMLPLQRFCRGVAEVTLTPPEMAGCAMLAVASAAIGQTTQVIVKRTWRETPLLFLLTVADPGKMKTPVIRLVGAPLARIDATLRSESKDARALWEAQKKALPKGECAGDPPAQRRAIVKDITRETLAAILRDNPRGVLVDPDEATAWVSSFNEYKSRGSDRQFWLAIWASSSLSVDREGGNRSIFVKDPLATVMGGLPPDMLGSLAEEHGRNDGFLDRILFCYPADFPPQRWTEEELDQGDEMTWAAIITTLHAQAMHREQSGEIRPHFIGFDWAAKARFISWYDAHCAESEALDMPPEHVGFWSKLRAYCTRFALILSRLRLALDPECSDLLQAPVRIEDVEGAIALVGYFKAQFLRINHRMTGGTGSREAMAVLSWIARNKVDEFRERDVRRTLIRRFPTAKELQPALACLIESGAIRPKNEPEDPHRKGRKPTRAYEVHPDLRGRSEIDNIDKKPFSGSPEG